MKSPLVLTLGEPSGIGPEIVVKAKTILKNKNPFFVIGNFNLITMVAEKHLLETKEIFQPSETFLHLDKLCIINHSLQEPVIPGKISLKNSSMIPDIIQKAVSLILAKKASGLVTNPINKWAIKQSVNFQHEGHTDFLAFLDKKNNASVMMLVNSEGFRVVPVTIHIPVKEISKKLTPKVIEDTIIILHKSLKSDFHIITPKIMVVGLNPHAGENTMMGYEEIDVISPVIIKLTKQGINLVGPVAADTAFTIDKRAKFDAFVCMYHDQALLPIKTISFEDCINITLGLSFVRTSPDHGTALDIAGLGTANPSSLILAINEAQKLADIRGLNEKKE